MCVLSLAFPYLLHRLRREGRPNPVRVFCCLVIIPVQILISLRRLSDAAELIPEHQTV